MFLFSCNSNSQVAEKANATVNNKTSQQATNPKVQNQANQAATTKANTQVASTSNDTGPKLNSKEWTNLSSGGYQGSAAMAEGDLFADENWNQIAINDYVENYRYYKHDKGIYYKGSQKVFRLDPKSAAKANRLKPQIPSIEKAFSLNGKKAPAYDFTDINGKKYNSKDLLGKVVIFNFWFVGCPPCQKEIPELNEIVAHYKNDKDVVFIAPSLNQMSKKLAPFLKKRSFDYNVTEMVMGLPQSFNVPAYPTHYVIDKKGDVQFATVGGLHTGIMKKYMIDKIESLR